jgi:hypothetical protein
VTYSTTERKSLCRIMYRLVTVDYVHSVYQTRMFNPGGIIRSESLAPAYTASPCGAARRTRNPEHFSNPNFAQYTYIVCCLFHFLRVYLCTYVKCKRIALDAEYERARPRYLYTITRAFIIIIKIRTFQTMMWRN